LRNEGPGGDANPGREVAEENVLVDVEMKNVGDLEVGAVIQHQIPADHDVNKVRWWRRKHHLEFARARLHSAAQAERQSPVDDQLALQAGRQVISLGQPRRQMAVVLVIPATEVAVVIGIAEMVMPVSVFVFALVAAVMVVAMPVIVIVIAIVLLVTVIVVVLSERDCRRQRQGKNCGGSGSKPSFR
jgi:hypothetical protein